MSLTLLQLHMEGSRMLLKAGIKEADLDAKYLLFEAFHLNHAGWLMNRNQTVKAEWESALKQYRDFIKRRCERIPLQYILGKQEFMGLEFYVNEHVLIPRQDTETLVELILKEQTDSDKKVIDLCTGSGCIAVSLAVLGHYKQVTGSDISKEALCVARKNACRLAGEENNLVFLQGDLFDALKDQPDAGKKFDMIVSNPPYISSAVIMGLEPEVRTFEPHIALDGFEDGLHFYRRLAKESVNYLNPGGCLYLEIGYDHGEAVSGLLEHAGFCEVKIVKDLPGNDRVVRGSLR